MAVQPETLETFDDRRLVAAFQAGDEDAFARIVGTHYSSLMAEARRRLRSAGDAEDAVQETLLRAYVALDRFGGDYHLRAWLGQILANACADIQSRRFREGRLHDRLASRREVVPSADEALGDADVRRVVTDAVASLPKSYRDAFVLREVEERSYAELAEEMKVTEANARARVHRARGALQRSLKGLGGALGGFALPLRFVSARFRLGGDRRSGPLVRGPLAPSTSKKAVTALRTGQSSGTARAMHAGGVLTEPAHQVPFADVSAVSQTALSAAPSASLSPLSQVSQALGQAAASPLSQTIMALAPDAAKTSVPVAGTLATLAAAGAAMVGSGTGIVSQASAAPTASPLTVAAAAASTGSYTQAPAAQSPTSPASAGASGTSRTSATSSSASSPSPSSTSPSTTSASSTGSLAAPGGNNAWSWVSNAASSSDTTGGSSDSSGGSGTSSSSSSSDPASATGSGSSSSAGSTTGSPTTSSGSSSDSGSTSSAGSTTSGSSDSATTTSAAQGAPAVPGSCPWTTSFPVAAPGPITASAPEPSGESAVAYFTASMVLPSASSAFQWEGQGTFSGDGGSGPVDTVAGICLAGTDDPVLVVNLTEPGASEPYVFQLRAGLVDTTVSGESVNSLYRGTGTWLDGPGADSPPVPFVADVVTPSQGDLLVAFFGSVSGLLGPPTSATCPTSASTGGSAGSDFSGAGSGTSSSSCAPPSGAEITSPDTSGSSS
ncbi:MAG TPA: RNA polymerase sigma factor [Acidimicrobiales bacterium]|nr:RNA polymerase sigma factor [Acidimicrobiales bacterium]